MCAAHGRRDARIVTRFDAPPAASRRAGAGGPERAEREFDRVEGFEARDVGVAVHGNQAVAADVRAQHFHALRSRVDEPHVLHA